MAPRIEEIARELAAIRAEMVAEEAAPHPLLDGVHEAWRESARNLLHYLVLRRRDLRPLQLRLAGVGLSSLGRAESGVLAAVDAVLGVLRRLVAGAPPSAGELAVVDLERGRRLLARHTDELLGPPNPGRPVRIMVTMPSEAADDYSLVHDLLQQGMDCMRINCAHDDAATWLRMIEHLRQAEQALGRSCRVVMDLAGPKLRTAPLAPGRAVIHLRPSRDEYGTVTAPARVWLTAKTAPDPAAPPPSPADACLQVPPEWLARLHVGERLRFTDARDARRRLVVVDVTERGCWAELAQSAYIVPGTILRRARKVAAGGNRDAEIEHLPPQSAALLLQENDLLVVTRDAEPGRPATLDSAGRVLTPASIGCTIPEAFDQVRAGEAIWFDDGKIGGVVEHVESTRILVRITRTRLGGGKLRADKGINLPGSELRLDALTARDIEDLAFVAEHADAVSLSFARSPEDVAALQKQLARREPPVAIVLKIETRLGFENLPDLLLTAMRSPRCGVMIARGDLAVECGFERLAEVQEEILWICEAAHVPVIWATEVLESLAKRGMPSRAEITDAAMGDRAECVMLNKGPHVRMAVQALDDILRRMQAHQTKKRAMLRELRLAHALDDEGAPPS